MAPVTGTRTASARMGGDALAASMSAPFSPRRRLQAEVPYRPPAGSARCRPGRCPAGRTTATTLKEPGALYGAGSFRQAAVDQTPKPCRSLTAYTQPTITLPGPHGWPYWQWVG